MSNEKFSRIVAYERLEDFVENATVCIHLVDQNGMVLYANRAELNLLGYTEEEYIGHSIADFHADQLTIGTILAKLLRKEELINYESELICKDGSKKNVLISSNVYSENGEFMHTRCFTRDITHLKKAEKLLLFLNKASEELSRMLDTKEALDKIISFIVPAYADWFTIYEQKAGGSVDLIKMAHADPAKIKWANQFRLKYPVDLNDDRPGTMAWVMKTGEAYLAADVTNEMIAAAAKSQEHFEILTNLAIVSVMSVPMISQGKVIGLVSFISSNPQNRYDEQDLNFAKNFTNRIALTLDNARLYEAAKYELELRKEADKRKDEFISIASHELKTPVTSLKAYTQILQMDLQHLADRNVPLMLAKMNNQVDKLTNLIVDLLDVTKIQTGEMTYNFEVFDFDMMVSEIVEEMQRTTTLHMIIFNPGDCEKLKADKNRLAQVVTNLISNAIKYAPTGGDILVTSSCADHKITLSVKDHGIGIPDEEKEKIFQRFFRVTGKNMQHTYPGLGLGLYISASIIKRHNGELTFTSTETEGSVFSFWLPTA